MPTPKLVRSAGADADGTSDAADGDVGIEDGSRPDGAYTPPECIPSPADEATVLGDVERGADGALRLRVVGEALVPPPDGDGDGVPDVADDEPTNPAVTGVEDGIVVVMDGSGGATVSVDWSVVLNRVDFYFLVETNGSMGSHIAELQSSLTSGTFIPGCAGGILVGR